MKLNKVWLKVLAIKLLGTAFAMGVYARFTPLSDSDNYVRSSLTIGDSSELSRTIIVKLVAGATASVFGPVGANIIFSLIVGAALYGVISQLSGARRTRAFGAILLPSVMVWTSIVGKEAFAVVGLLLVFRAWGRYLIRADGWIDKVLVLIGLLLIGVIRPPYLVAVVWLLGATALFVPRRPDESVFGFIRGVSSVSNGILIAGLLMFGILFFNQIYFLVSAVVDRGLIYFGQSATSTDRGWVVWTTHMDYWRSLWWSLFFGIIGPLPSEVVRRPIFFPFFVEGILIFYLCIAGIFQSIRSATLLNPMARRAFFRIVGFGFFPAMGWLLIVQAAFGTVNPGSATRYRTGFEFFLTIGPLIIWEAVRMYQIRMKSEKL